jgi:hypothetical protein
MGSKCEKWRHQVKGKPNNNMWIWNIYTGHTYYGSGVVVMVGEVKRC